MHLPESMTIHEARAHPSIVEFSTTEQRGNDDTAWDIVWAAADDGTLYQEGFIAGEGGADVPSGRLYRRSRTTISGTSS